MARGIVVPTSYNNRFNGSAVQDKMDSQAQISNLFELQLGDSYLECEEFPELHINESDSALAGAS